MPRPRIAAYATLLTATVALMLAGCVPSPPERTAPEENFSAPVEAPQLIADGTAEDNLPYFTETLRQYSVGTEAIEGAPVVNALAAAGFEKSVMQVSFDRSKTDLVADNIFVSVRFGEECLIGQIVTSDRSFVTLVDPALGPETNICLIGTTRVIDW